jgi:hypothetical protein
MIQCSMLNSLSRRCRNHGDVQARIDRFLYGVECAFVLVSCVDSECLKRYSATVREFRREGARVTEMKLPYAAVVSLKQGSKP